MLSIYCYFEDKTIFIFQTSDKKKNPTANSVFVFTFGPYYKRAELVKNCNSIAYKGGILWEFFGGKHQINKNSRLGFIESVLEKLYMYNMQHSQRQHCPYLLANSNKSKLYREENLILKGSGRKKNLKIADSILLSQFINSNVARTTANGANLLQQ